MNKILFRPSGTFPTQPRQPGHQITTTLYMWPHSNIKVHVVQVDRNVHQNMMCIKAYLRMWPMFSIIITKSRLVPIQLQRNCNKTCTNMVCIETYMYVYMYLDDIEHGAHWCTSTNADAYHVVLPLHQGH